MIQCTAQPSRRSAHPGLLHHAPVAEVGLKGVWAVVLPPRPLQKGGLLVTYFTDGAHLTGHARINGGGNMASGASSCLRGVDERRSAA